uniref:E3 ubiquitin-protein ligase TRIM39-like n=1 Tax=Lepisosteus oculatus TaxID=7918 RepID=W5MK03_LEPOC
MASPSSVLSEEQFQCSICLDTFTSPVSTPCGHSFCLACISGYWDSSDVCQCPVCKKTFPIIPDLSVNRSLAEITEHFKRTRVSSDEGLCAKPGEVSCDFCTGRKLKAVKSCLVCLASYCETHIQPHYQGAAFRRHRLIEPVESLEDRLCQKHERLLELFCRTDQTCICQFCSESDHRTHSTVPLEQECGVKKTQLRKTEAEVQQMIQDRLKKVEEIKQAVELSKSCEQREMEDSLQVFTALQCCIERSQAEFIELIEEKQRAAERRAEGIIHELEQEITELKRGNTELEQLSHTEDHIHFLQSFPTLCSPPHPKDWSDITVHPDLCLGALSKAVCQLEDRLIEEMEKVPGVKFERLRKHAADVTLDPDTAHCDLSLSEDGKRVRLGQRKSLPDNPHRFSYWECVLSREGFIAGRHYWEVEVNNWWRIGLSRESAERKGDFSFSPQEGYWCLDFGSSGISALTDPVTPLPLSLQPRRLGVCVDIEERKVSFYTVESRTLIYTFTDMVFNQGEKIYPVFWTLDLGKNLVLLPAVSCGD